ncbi:amino acid/amide ABC transporter substrate-binding protein (HAAT family) [Lacinutrix venerupis]|uniref:PBP1 and LysM peptidoglycan-binding domain-containing protein n=1 Tax=Lacinutrix venerupis TaxID=1486034 RepID=UPI000EB475DB|nr:LysM peptidoglycan-binding domain-containing protein [Lacinutrix venerupis]RLJ62566.1 amino acid/amide ABC transporter substrate-binding protein (HAAT family) [Lacinutrix venerupis]
MKKIIYILSLLLFFTCASVNAQKYNTHRVKSGETLETIAKDYKVSTTDILKLNPDAKEKLRPNAILIIPNESSEAVTSVTPVQTAQDTIVEKTFDHYIKHKTKRKETLFSISKEYNVEIEDIKKHNTFLYANNLRKGDKLQIPVFKTVTKYVKSKNATYVVQPKEGKWRIAYKYGITVQELEALNPNMPSMLKPGQTINVPNLESNKVKTFDEQYSYYKVLPKEGFYRLKVKLGLEQADLERLNPELTTTGLKEGMILKVPLDTIANNTTIDNSQFNGIDNVSEIVQLSNNVTDSSTKNIAVMLPFTLNKINTDSVFDSKSKIKNDRTLGVTLDFYSGVLIALDSVKRLGVNLKVDVYDTQNRLSEVSSIIRNNDFSNTHAVIGPLLPNNFNTAASALEQDNIPIISPVVKTVNIGRNVFQSRPNDADLKSKIIDYFKADSTAQIIIVSDLKRKASSTNLKNKFANAKLVNSRLDKKTQKDEYFVVEQDLVSVIKPGNNVVFLETDNAGFVSNVSSLLNGLQVEGTKITLATTNENKAFEHDEVDNYHLSNLNFTYPSISKMLNSETSNSFVKEYKQKYNISPNAYAIRGFDLTMDVVLRLATSQDLYQSVEDAPMTSYIENKFAYKKKLFGGYYNESVYLVRYKDLVIEEVKQ